MLSKTESAAQVDALAPRDVIALVETPRGACSPPRSPPPSVPWR